jgi:flagellar basal body-associated protein FliL
MKSNKTQKKKKSSKKIIIIEGVIALLILALAIILCYNLKKLIISRIYHTIELVPNSEGYKTWLTPPTIITRGYHLFNISNPLDIATDPSTTTAKIKETEAYSYLLSATKQDVQWSEDQQSISYSIYRLFNRHPTQFNPSAVNDTGIFVNMLRALFRTQFDSKASPAFFDIGGYSPFIIEML